MSSNVDDFGHIDRVFAPTSQQAEEGKMMSAAIRVLARAVAIQLEEMAASTSTAAGRTVYRTGLDKGKGRADAIPSELSQTATADRQTVDVDPRGEEIVHEQQELLEREQLRIPDPGPSRIPIPPLDRARPPTFARRPLGVLESASKATASTRNLDGLSSSFSALVDEKPSTSEDILTTPVPKIEVGSKTTAQTKLDSTPKTSRDSLSVDEHAAGLSKVQDGIGQQFGALVDEKPSAAPSDFSEAAGNTVGEREFARSDQHQASATSSKPDTTPLSDYSVREKPDGELPSTSHYPQDLPQDSPITKPPIVNPVEVEEEVAPVLRASTVPSSRIGRLFHYGSLAASLSWGAASESLKRGTGGGSSGSVFMSDANVRRLVASLSRMRGAALKLGQFMSIQDNHMLPPEIEKVLQQVQAHANYMPDWQMEKVISTELGTSWADLFSNFERTPIASASIGQVHRATLAENNTPVAVKIQFPGIADSISSDLGYLTPLLRSSSVLPKGMFLQNTVAVMRRELADECDYVREGAAAERFRGLLEGDSLFEVPRVIQEATTGRVLTMEWAEGKPLSKVKGLSQATKDKIGTNILRLCLMELFQFRFMQTDPNLANFLYDAPRDRMTLIDFGASREYSKEFMDGWYRLLTAAIRGDRVEMKNSSEEIGYLTRDENDEMVNAHLDSMALVASPFAHSGPYDFSNQTITDSVRQLIPIMLKHRLTPPPQETYSLNRKLSGAFLVCAKLGARVDCGKLWDECVSGYQVGAESGAVEPAAERMAATA